MVCYSSLSMWGDCAKYMKITLDWCFPHSTKLWSTIRCEFPLDFSEFRDYFLVLQYFNEVMDSHVWHQKCKVQQSSQTHVQDWQLLRIEIRICFHSGRSKPFLIWKGPGGCQGKLIYGNTTFQTQHIGCLRDRKDVNKKRIDILSYEKCIIQGHAIWGLGSRTGVLVDSMNRQVNDFMLWIVHVFKWDSFSMPHIQIFSFKFIESINERLRDNFHVLHEIKISPLVFVSFPW